MKRIAIISCTLIFCSGLLWYAWAKWETIQWEHAYYFAEFLFPLFILIMLIKKIEDKEFKRMMEVPAYYICVRILFEAITCFDINLLYNPWLRFFLFLIAILCAGITALRSLKIKEWK